MAQFIMDNTKTDYQTEKAGRKTRMAILMKETIAMDSQAEKA